MKTYTPKEVVTNEGILYSAIDNILRIPTHVDYDSYIIAVDEVGVKALRDYKVSKIGSSPCEKVDSEKPKVTLDEIEGRMGRSTPSNELPNPVGLNIKCPWRDEFYFYPVKGWNELLMVKYALDRIEAGAEGWEVSFCE